MKKKKLSIGQIIFSIFAFIVVIAAFCGTVLNVTDTDLKYFFNPQSKEEIVPIGSEWVLKGNPDYEDITVTGRVTEITYDSLFVRGNLYITLPLGAKDYTVTRYRDIRAFGQLDPCLLTISFFDGSGILANRSWQGCFELTTEDGHKFGFYIADTVKIVP